MDYETFGEEIINMIAEGNESYKHEIVMVPVEKIYPHPDNPRKNLGDLEELTESIRERGVLQNLTVIPWDDCYKWYDESLPAPCKGAVVTVIGHRRAAAAKAAGLREVPCLITTLSMTEQLSMMLLENLQRADLTIYEQAQGFQMMMDLGSTVEEISELTGFAERTVQRRLQIAKLPKEAFREDIASSLRLEDYVQIARLKSNARQEEALRYAGTASFEWKIKDLLEQEQLHEDLKKVKPMLEEAGYKPYTGKENSPYYSAAYVRVWEETPANILKAGALPVTTKKLKNPQWTVYLKRVVLLDDAEKKKEKIDKKKLEADKTRKEMKDLCRTAERRRWEWIYNYKPKKEHEKIINRWYLEMSIREISQNRGSPDYQLLYDAVKKVPVSKWHRPSNEDLMRAIDEDHALAYVTWVLTGDGPDVLPYDEGFMETPPRYDEHKSGLQIWKRSYDFLQTLGYPVSDEERAILDGTHELYGNKK